MRCEKKPKHEEKDKRGGSEERLKGQTLRSGSLTGAGKSKEY
jgi:hypothetical protein